MVDDDCKMPELMILLSGGVDSAACVNIYLELGRPICGLFIDYGQLSAAQEKISAQAIANYYSIPLAVAKWEGPLPKSAGMIQSRNGFLIMAALMERPQSVTGIAIGIHAGTGYSDCSKPFITSIQEVVNAYANGIVEILAPFIDWQKSDIYSYCRSNNVPIHLTYSCECGGPPPCGKCLSCKDRELLDAST